MPRRGGGRGWNQGAQPRSNTGGYADEHDDRDRKPSTKRRVSFKPSGIGRDRAPNKSRWELAIKTRLDDDEEMEDNASSFRGDNKTRRKGSPIPRGKLGSRKLGHGIFGWYQVTILYGSKYEKDLIIRNILNAISPDIFIPHYWKVHKNLVNFYLDDARIAERLWNIDRTIQMPDGFKLGIRVRSGLPIVNVDDALKERMKLAMVKRYNPTTKALDLSKFHADPDLKDVFCALFRPVIMTAAIDIIAGNIPDLEALNLNGNSITQLDHFKNIAEKLPKIKILYLADNRIHSISSLQAFKGLPIVELALKNNPFRNRYRQEAILISEIRKKFPKLMKLDGQELEPQIVFDVQEASSLPEPRASFLCDASLSDIITKFLEQYFIIFDSDNRQPLLDAYHEQAMISLTLPHSSQVGKIPTFWPYNRNLLRSHDADTKLLRYGRLPCVSLLSEFPKTQHDPLSFSFDLSLFTPKLISFTVAGVFKQLPTSSNSSQNSELRSFQRCFVIVPAGAGFCIRNEMIFISNPTPAQVKAAFKPAPAPTPATAVQTRLDPIPSTSQVTPTAPSIPPVLDEPTKMQMIQAMASQSNMNLEWSRKCLEETNWDFAHAAYVFDKLNKENRIPPQAFTK